MRVAVLGAGAIGCLVGGLLAAAGHDVVLIGRPERLAAVARHGLVLDLPAASPPRYPQGRPGRGTGGPGSSRRARVARRRWAPGDEGAPGHPAGPAAGEPREETGDASGPGGAGDAGGGHPGPAAARGLRVAVTASPAEAAARWGEPEAVALTVKAFAVERALTDLAAAWPGVPAVVTFQNGLGAEERVAAVLGPGRVVAGTVTLSAALEGHRVRVFNRRGGLVLAPLAGGEEACARLLTAWTPGLGVPLGAAADAVSLKWSKLLLNLVGNAVGAILGWDVGRIFRDPVARRIEHRSLREAVAVARVAAPRLVDLPGYPVRAFARLVEWLPAGIFARVAGPAAAGGRGGKLPSVALDLAAGRRPTEITALHGAVARTARRLGLDAPACAALAELVEELAGAPALRDAFRHRPDRLAEALARRGVPI